MTFGRARTRPVVEETAVPVGPDTFGEPLVGPKMSRCLYSATVSSSPSFCLNNLFIRFLTMSGNNESDLQRDKDEGSGVELLFWWVIRTGRSSPRTKTK